MTTTPQLRPYQQELADAVRDAFRSGARCPLVVASTGAGKCLARGTPVLMFDGTIKPVEAVNDNDLVMGPDSQPRRVVGTSQGQEMLYRVTPTKGDAYTVNESHILSLRNRRGVVTNIEVREYIKETSRWKARHHGWRVPGILCGDLTPELVSITVEPAGVGDYFGFELEGPDRLFLLGDFTVTHNTVLFSYITHGAAGRGNPTLIAAHRKEIIRQISLSLARFGVEHQVIAPAPAVRQIQLAHFKAFGRSYVRQNSITMVGSVQTIVTRFEQVDATLKLARTTAGSRPVKMLVVMDEGHHVVEDTQWGRVMDRYHREAGGLGLIVTASPERLDGRGLGAGFGGYADTMIEAPPMSWLIEQGFLSRYRVFTTPHQISMDGVHTRMGDFVAAEVQERVDKPSVTGDAIEHWRKHAHGMRAVVFCVSVEHSQHVAQEFQAAGIPAAHIDGSIDDTERDRAVSEFADGKVLILTQVNLVSEGFDLGSIAQKDVTIDCIIDLAPTQSLVNAMQRWGRALRPAPGKVAVILDHAGNIIRHGFPDEDREWTLEGRKKSKRGAANDNDAPEVHITTCPKCFAIHKPAPSCPACGHIYPIKARQVEQIDGTLAELDADAAREAREARKAQGQAQTVEDMMRTLGYSRGRAEKILQAREEKARLQDEVKAELLAWQAENRRPVKDAFGVFLADVKMMKPKELRELLDRVKADRYKLTA